LACNLITLYTDSVMEWHLTSDGRIDLSGWLREAEIEAENYRVQKRLVLAPSPLVIIKASNKGIGESYVVQRLRDALPKL